MNSCFLHNFALLAVSNHLSFQLLLSVCTWEKEREDDNFICTKCEHLTNTQWWRHYLKITISPHVSPLVTIFAYPLPPVTSFLNCPKLFTLSLIRRKYFGSSLLWFCNISPILKLTLRLPEDFLPNYSSGEVRFTIIYLILWLVG